ncbi:MAG TPA: phasin family protein [Candidatus Sulfotelmatobacter sp.]|nr:phasin family protein [Candidatus Sulfotelmatobacter sp.]
MTKPPGPAPVFSIVRAQELATAGATVLNARAAMIRVALADPANANHAELQRMVVEKAEAVTEIGRLSWLAWASVASTAMTAWTNQARIGAAYASALAGARSPFDVVAAQTRFASNAAAAAARSATDLGAAIARTAEAPLRPLHRRLTANGKRLSEQS